MNNVMNEFEPIEDIEDRETQGLAFFIKIVFFLVVCNIPYVGSPNLGSSTSTMFAIQRGNNDRFWKKIEPIEVRYSEKKFGDFLRTISQKYCSIKHGRKWM